MLAALFLAAAASFSRAGEVAASPQWRAALSAQLPEFSAALTPSQQLDRFGPLAAQLERFGQTPASFSALKVEDRAALADLARRDAAEAVDKRVWAVIAAAPGPEAAIDPVAARGAVGALDDALQTYAPYLSPDTKHAARLAREAYAARLSAVEAAALLSPRRQAEAVAAADAAENESLGRLEKARSAGRAARAVRQAEVDRARERVYLSQVSDGEVVYSMAASFTAAMVGWSYGPKGAAIMAGLVVAGAFLLPLRDGGRALRLRGWKSAAVTALVGAFTFGFVGLLCRFRGLN